MTSFSSTHHLTKNSRGNREGWIGVDIGSASLKLAKVARVSGRWQLCFARLLPIAPAAVSSLEGLRQTLSESLRGSFAWRARPTACLLPWSLTQLRTTELPPAADDELAQLVMAEVADGEQAGSEEYEVAHWRSCATREASQPAAVHILSIPSTTTSGVIQSLTTAKLDCHVVDARPFALARAVAMVTGTHSAKTIAAIDWGFEQVTVVLVRDGIPYFTRILKGHGLRPMLENLQKGLKLSHDEAATLLCQFTLQTSARREDGKDDVSRALHNFTREPITRTVQEVKRTLSFAKLEHADLEPDEAMLFGGGATIQGVDQLLAAECGVPVKTWSLTDGKQFASTATYSSAVFGEAIALSAIPLLP